MSGVLINPFMVQAAAGGGPTVPGAPTLTSVTNAVIGYDWDMEQDIWGFIVTGSAPASDGGSAITRYNLRRSPDNAIASFASTPSWTSEGGAGNSDYYLTAVNAIGESAPSNIVTATG